MWPLANEWPTGPGCIIITYIYFTSIIQTPPYYPQYIPCFVCLILEFLLRWCSLFDPTYPKMHHIPTGSAKLLMRVYRHLHITDSLLGPRETKIHINSTSIIQTPPYYRQFTWSKRDQNSYKLYLYNTDTSILQTVHMVIKIAAL